MKNKTISGKTQICGVIGDPIEHTMSPVMHNASFSALGLDYVYVAFRVKSDELAGAIEGMRALNIRGLNVTIPHKVNIIPLLDGLDTLADKIGAVNTIVNRDGILKGHNTDANGFLQALLDKGVTPEGKNVVILGAGGAARAISFILAEKRANLLILNRLEEIDWAEELARKISSVFGKEVRALELNDANLKTALDKAELLVNATSVGMSPNTNLNPVPSRLLRPGLVVFDIVYNPIKTKLATEASLAGCETVMGLDMLVWQGALAFEMWTGKKAPVDIMKREAIKVLKSHEN
jgi:shikimate dehydrogenase